MTTVDIRPADLDDPAAVDSWLDCAIAGWRHDQPDEAKPSRERFVHRVRDPGPGREPALFFAWRDGRVAGFVRTEITTIDNLHTAQLSGQVRPELRRQGIGRALWAHALADVRAKGRTTVGANACAPVDGGLPRTGDGAAFLKAMGLTAKLTMVRRRLDLSAVDKERVEAQLAEGWTHAGGYELRVWVSHTPPDLIDDIAYLDGRLLEDAPTGDLDIEPFKVDAQRVREQEAAAARAMRTGLNAALVHTATGRIAAWSFIGHELVHNGYGSQGVTIVDPDHRGHRLGMVVKLELQKYATAVTPGLRVIETYNADSNAHMIRINDLVGFRPVDAWLNCQATLAELDGQGE